MKKRHETEGQLEFSWEGAPPPQTPPDGTNRTNRTNGTNGAHGLRASANEATPLGDNADREARATAVRAALRERTGRFILLTVTDNVSSVLSVKHDRATGHVRLRLHHMFLSADTSILDALAHWILHPRSERQGAIIDAFIRQHRDEIGTRPNAAAKLEPKGKHFDLRVLLDEVNRAWFDGAVDAAITWGRLNPVARQRSIRFGSYWERDNLIRIHPLLDQDFVPEFFVRYIVFHEMLHAALAKESPRGDGRRIVHGAEFRRREQAYPDYERATAWETSNLKRLLRGKRVWPF